MRTRLKYGAKAGLLAGKESVNSRSVTGKKSLEVAKKTFVSKGFLELVQVVAPLEARGVGGGEAAVGPEARGAVVELGRERDRDRAAHEQEEEASELHGEECRCCRGRPD